MGKLFLCKERKANNPFYIRCIDKNVYTMEELCFFFYHEMYFVEEFHDWAELAGWLKREMKNEALAKEIQRLVVGYDTKIQMVQLILEDAHYRLGEELLEYEKKMEQIHKSTGFMRSKKRADYLVRNMKYTQAIELYTQIINSDNKPDDNILSDVYHNLGVIYGKLFYFEKAAGNFLKAFELVPSRESLKQYKLAMKLAGKEETDENIMLDLPSVKQLDSLIDDEIEALIGEMADENSDFSKLQQLKIDGKINEYYKMMDKILMDWKEECRNCM